eukprot:CAMPEP_0172410188 /NCGR_PEP_ID=MMETSP1061-20121228/76749_1 /TAXON_ID=37318 /ORGANISM="Pseudo-nitzschia pungens, Strain cf. pungens" /LENGTH=391 /DNA_ID=CAMNT_0013146359 /DNA_START=702 /DNA_END=1877 /DNA_ORIENTATION=+
MSTNSSMSDRTKGLLILLAGMIVVSPDAVLTRFLSEGGSSIWTIVFWRMFFAAPVAAPFAVYEAGGFAELWKSVRAARRYYVFIVPLQALVEIGFVLAFVHTTAAKALLLINLDPLWCALFGRLVLGETLPLRTIVALGLAMSCVALIFVPELIGGGAGVGAGVDNDQVTDDGSSPLGNWMALATGIGLAAYIATVRHAGILEEPLSLIGSTVGGVVLAMVVSLVVTRGRVMPDWEFAPWKFWAASVGHGASIGFLFVAMTTAPRLVTAAEVGLGALLEVVLGPLLVGLVYGDVPSEWTVIGGSLLLLVLAVHELIPVLLLVNREKAAVVETNGCTEKNVSNEIMDKDKDKDIEMDIEMDKDKERDIEMDIEMDKDSEIDDGDSPSKVFDR